MGFVWALVVAVLLVLWVLVLWAFPGLTIIHLLLVVVIGIVLWRLATNRNPQGG